MNKKSELLKIITLGMIVVGMFAILVGCKTQNLSNSDEIVLTVDDSKVYLDEMMYHFLLAELQGEMYASFLGKEDTYWSTEDNNGVSIAEIAKKEVMNNAIKYEILYQMALDEGYALTEEEEDISNGKVQSILKNVPKEQLEATGLTETKLLEIQNKIALCTRYYDEYVKKLGVNEEEIKSKIDIKDYKQYNIQYVFANTKKLDNPQTAYKDLSSILEEAKTAEDITTISKPLTLTAGTLSFIENENIFGEEFILEETTRRMQVGEVSDIVETVNGYYIIKLVNNTSTEKYDDAIRQAIEKAKTDAFEANYKELKKKHKIKIKERVWDDIQLDNFVE